MNKKFFTIVLVVLLAMTCVFAYKGEMKVGANLGVGVDGTGKSIDKNTTETRLYGGLYGAGTFQYGLTDGLYVKAEVGANNFSLFYHTISGKDPVSVETDSRTTNVIVSAGLLYDIPIGRIFAIDLQLTAETIFGKPAYSSETSNVAYGVGFGSAAVFNITDDFSVNFNSKFSIYIASSNSEYAKIVKDNGLILVGAQENIGFTYSL